MNNKDNIMYVDYSRHSVYTVWCTEGITSSMYSDRQYTCALQTFSYHKLSLKKSQLTSSCMYTPIHACTQKVVLYGAFGLKLASITN